MPIGSSGRIVIEVEPSLKRELHKVLRNSGSNLKEWFVDQAEAFLAGDQQQLEMPLEEDNTKVKEQSA